MKPVCTFGILADSLQHKRSIVFQVDGVLVEGVVRAIELEGGERCYNVRLITKENKNQTLCIKTYD